MKQSGLSVVGLVAFASGVVAYPSCGNSVDDLDLKPPPGFTAPLVLPLRRNPAGPGRLGFGDGFFSLEVGGNGGTWRWMGRRGEVRLLNRQKRCRLRITGWIPQEFMRTPPTIQLSIGNRDLARFSQKERSIDWNYTIEPEWLGSEPSVLLLIETSATVRAPGDTRDLGVSVERLLWESP
jgi:hypothetical protein